MITTLAFILVPIMVIVGIYMLFILKNQKYIYVDFSEIVGNQIIKHPTLYKATIDKDEKSIKIQGLGISRPNPPVRYLIPTNNNNKVVSICKIDNDRFAYRIPSLHNEVIIEKRDDKGNILKNEQGKPILEKLKWTFTDFVFEPDDRHWYEQEITKNLERNKQKDNFLSKYAGVIALSFIILGGIFAIHFNVKLASETVEMWKADKAEIMQEAERVSKEAQKTQQNLNWLIEKISGQRVFEDENREEYYNQTKTE